MMIITVIKRRYRADAEHTSTLLQICSHAEVHCETFQINPGYKQAFQHLSRPLSLSLCFSCAIPLFRGSRDPADKGSGMPDSGALQWIWIGADVYRFLRPQTSRNTSDWTKATLKQSWFNFLLHYRQTWQIWRLKTPYHKIFKIFSIFNIWRVLYC